MQEIWDLVSLNTSHGVINYMKFLSKCVADQNEWPLISYKNNIANASNISMNVGHLDLGILTCI